jgi:hypothetical protein
MALVPLIDLPNRHSDRVAVQPRNNLTAQILDFFAGAAINPRRIVKFDTPLNTVIQSAAAADAHIGVYQGDVLAAVGQEVAIGVDGIVEVEAGAAITQGATLSADAQGRAVTAVSTNAAWGTALSAATAAGQIIKARIAPRAIVA